MSFADSMNSLDAMNDDEVVINEIRLPSIKSLALKVISLFKPGNTVDASRAQYIQQPNISQHS
ncbi:MULTISPECIES: hypothetical protein [Pseudomonas]|uniref:hypothetical protein n=1 Tax=Pseudomonas TaxID=286 RepID=UPI00235597E5|nr:MULTISPECIES: hypothetical protein [Pseudomonas]